MNAGRNASGGSQSIAAHGQQALSLFDPDRIDLLVLDLGLPMKSGWDIFEEITNQDPVLPIIIITGQPNQRFTACAAGVGALMEKPLDVPALLQTMEDLLAEPHEARLKRLWPGPESAVRSPGQHHVPEKRARPFSRAISPAEA
jgi:two-component system, OmpR family, copper resistance phosphate regulon response regulator CusR